MRNLTYIFAIYLGLERNDLVEIKLQADDEGEAWSKVKMILGEHVDVRVTGLHLNDWYENV